MPRADPKNADAPIASKRIRRGGRQKGVKNKKTVEREEQERIEAIRAASLGKALVVRDTVGKASAQTKKLAKEVLRDCMESVVAMAAIVEPWPAEMGKNPHENRAQFLELVTLGAAMAKDLAPFESPRYSAVMIGATVVNKIEVVGGMPDDFAAPRLEGTFAPGTVITADYNVLADEPVKPRDAA